MPNTSTFWPLEIGNIHTIRTGVTMMIASVTIFGICSP